MRILLTFGGTLVFGIVGAIIGIFALSGTNIVLPGLGLIISGSLFGAVLGFIAGAVIGLVIGYIAGGRLAKSI